ncbi:uncharacterized protein LDX57_003514 [Aspergillus melleus]|uniref:uncharacterized protein n=1 Tax=Aspergillus melleus TaxID=138277 RepID=UPI001E8E4F64|nr:uncharacterized protein LDX57_003514 [Aspergillus melleus]KAH8425768.1 hypothetical protein LDX57_003514 [Aspergillus melleus]
MEPEEEAPPPPYSAVDPLSSSANRNSPSDRNAAASAEVNRVLLRLRGGDAPLSDTASSDGSSSVLALTTRSPLLPVHFTSAAAYFVDRPPPTSDDRRSVQEHQITIYPRSQSKDFPRRPRCWGARPEDLTQQDWDMFLRYLFPPHLGLASASGQLPRQVRAEIQRDRKDRPQETDEQRRMRVSAVITEWNQYFFEPRATRIVFAYVTDPQNAPPSPLCPRCYPAATRVSQENRMVQAPEAGRSRLARPSLPPAAVRQQPASLQTGQHYPPTPLYNYPNPPMHQAPYSPYGAPPYLNPPAPQPPNAYPYPPPQPPLPYQQQYQWGYNARPYAPMPQDSGSKGGPFGWFASLASQAQKYGERITEQAQQYGDQISAHAQHYGRQVEEQAMAHGRWIEEQAGFSGQKTNNQFNGSMVHRPRGAGGEWAATDPRSQAAYYPNAYPYPYSTVSSPAEPVAAPALPQRPRRASTCSTSSDSSLTSIDSLSTTSELSSSDLATVRAQLLSLDDHHDRDLYEAAVGLRRQLTLLQDSRRQTRQAGRGHWRNGWGQQAQQGYGRGGWGRWESPQQHQRSWAEKRALKEETKATRKAFRDVLRRARDEHREQRRLKRNRVRQEQRNRQVETPPSEPPLEQRLQNLELDHTNRESRSTVQSFCPSPTRSLVSEVSEISSISTPSSVSSRRSNHQTHIGKSELSASKSDPKGTDKKQDDAEKPSDKSNPSS